MIYCYLQSMLYSEACVIFDVSDSYIDMNISLSSGIPLYSVYHCVIMFVQDNSCF